MKNKIVQILKENSDTMRSESSEIPNNITFIGSMNYENIADKIFELMGSPLIQINEKKVGLKRVHAEYHFSKKAPVSLIIQHLELAIKAIKEAVQKQVTCEVQNSGEFINESALDAFIEKATHNIPVGRLSIKEEEVYWLKK